MSWNGFVKAVNRATTTVMQSTGAIEKTIDKDFEDEERRFKNFEVKVEALHRESKGFLDSVRAMTLAQARIAETVDQFYDESASLANAGRKYKETVCLMDSNARTQLDNNYRTAIIDPLGKLISIFPDFNDAIKKRQKKLLDYDRLRATVRKLVDKPSDDPQKLPRAEQEANQARDFYESVNRQLITEIPKMIDMRVAYLHPSFEALVKSQLQFNEDAFYSLNSISKSFNESQTGSLEGRVENALQRMKELTICRSLQA